MYPPITPMKSTSVTNIGKTNVKERTRGVTDNYNSLYLEFAEHRFVLLLS